MNSSRIFDVIIIGGSYAGLSAAMSLGRAMRHVLVLDSNDPCNKRTPHSHNFVTQDGATPAVIHSKIIAELQPYATVQLKGALVTNVTGSDGAFEVQTEDEIFQAKKILFATGIKNNLPDIPGFADSWGISVLHCPYCHGYEIRNQPTGIFANGANAMHMAKLINNWTKSLTVFTNGAAIFTDEERALLTKNSIAVVEDTIVNIAHRNGYIVQLEFENREAFKLNALYARLPFVQHTTLPQQLGCAINDDGFIVTDEMKKTSVKGVYAAGDNISPMRSVANAVAAGSMAGAIINHELIEEEFK